MKARDLNHQNIMNLITAKIIVIVADRKEAPATVTGLLHDIMHTEGLVSVTVGSQQLSLQTDDDVTIHSTYLGSQAAEIGTLVREASKETPA